jgi:flagellar hook-associated protein 2
MGAVGLSFGSPTSGAGFDVSSTVSQIVANLQNVETPWKNQLTSLESQDAAISSLGTLFSNLSNDMSQLTAASSSSTAGTHTVIVNSLAQTSSGYLSEIASAAETLSGSITIQAGSGKPQTITLNSSDSTLSGLAAAINASGAGISASVLTDASGSRLSLVSGTSGAGGSLVISNNSIAAAAANTLSYAGTAGTNTVNSAGALSPVSTLADALSGSISIQVGSGAAQAVAVPTADQTLTGLMNAINGTAGIGVTASIVTNNDGTSSLALASQTAGAAGTLAVNSSVSDAVTAMGYNTAVAGVNASMTVDGVNLTSASNTVSNLIPGVTFQLLSSSSQPVQVVIGNDNTGVESAVNSFVSDYNAAISAVNAQHGNTSAGTPEPLFGSPTLSLLQEQILSGLTTQNPNGYLGAVSSKAGTTLSGSFSIQVGGGTTENVVIGAAPGSPAANTIYTGSGVNTVAGVAAAVNAAGIGVTANVVTSNGQSTLTLLSQTASAANGKLTVTSALTSNTPAALGYTDSGFTSSTPDSGTLGSVANAADTLNGSLTLQVGGGAAQTITLDSSDNTLSGLMNAINSANLGITAALNTNGTALTLTSGVNGAAGALTVNSSLLDTTDTSSAAMNYNPSSDLNNLTDLGISVNNDGTMTFNATTLDSLLNSDYSGVVGFFQNANSWGQAFSGVLSNAGNGSSTGILALATRSNSGTESTLNAEISKEQIFISTQQAKLTAELNQANQILQQLPSQLEGVNELYSAITGFNQNRNG